MSLLGKIFGGVKASAAAVTDHLAHVGERVAAVNVTVGPVTATVYPHNPQTPQAPAPPKTCAHCGAVKP